jgi:hypothetical protein
MELPLLLQAGAQRVSQPPTPDKAVSVITSCGVSDPISLDVGLEVPSERGPIVTHAAETMSAMGHKRTFAAHAPRPFSGSIIRQRYRWCDQGQTE